MNPTPQGRRGGFTLVELLMVVAVLIIAAAIVIPNIGSAADAQAVSAARMLAADLEVARNLALKTQRPHTVLFRSDRQAYKVVADYGGEAYASATAVDHPVISGRTFEIVPADRNGTGAVEVLSVSFGGNTYVTFNELGEPSAPGTITLQAGETQMQITVAGLTGSVTTTRVAN
jgi:type II secretion system protein H